MASNEIRPALLFVLIASAALAGCSVSGPRESPIVAATRGSPTVVDVYRGQGNVTNLSSQPGQQSKDTARDSLRRQSVARGVDQGDGDTQRYWSAIEPMRQRFSRLPNPDLVMVVYPHLAKGQYPVPGYVTVFPMYEQANLYALPGEVEEDLLQGRSAFAPSASKEGR